MDLKGEAFNANKRCEESQSYIKVLQTQNDDLGMRLVAFKEEHDQNILHKINVIRELEDKLLEEKTNKDRLTTE